MKEAFDRAGEEADQLIAHLNARVDAAGQGGTESVVFAPHWPEGVEPVTFYEFPCDDNGRKGGSWLRVMIAQDGDAHVSMCDWEDIGEEGTHPSPFPSVRCRTGTGGGRHRRTRQALLWLAQAIRLDNEELKSNTLD